MRHGFIVGSRHNEWLSQVISHAALYSCSHCLIDNNRTLLHMFIEFRGITLMFIHSVSGCAIVPAYKKLNVVDYI